MATAIPYRVTKGAFDFIVPVELVEERQTREKTRETLEMTRRCFDLGRTLIFFPFWADVIYGLEATAVP